MRWYYPVIGLAGLCLLLLLAYFQQRDMLNGLPARIVCASEAEAVLKAGAGAIPVRGTGSMVPFIPASPANPMSIVAYAAPSGKRYNELRKGDLVVYYADWAKGNVIHQAAQKDGKGWIMSGLGNKQSESFARVTEKDFFFHVEAVYVWNL
jgi:hypothetical protein